MSSSRAASAPRRAAASASVSSRSVWSASAIAADVARLDDRARAEPAHDLAEAADVVDDRGQPGAERLEERAGDVDLRAGTGRARPSPRSARA